MPEITEAELKKQIEQSNFAGLYFLYGEEKYLVSHYMKKLSEKASGRQFTDFNFQKFDGGETGADRIAEAAQSLPFFAERKCVLVSDPDADSMKTVEAEKWKEMIMSLPETTVLVVALPNLEVDEKKGKNWKKLIDLMKSNGNVVRFGRRTDAQLQKLLCSGAQKRGCVLSPRNAGRLVACCGSDLTALFGELEKLCSYVKQGEITEQLIDGFAVKNLEARVFDLSKAVLSGSGDRAYSILNLLLEQGEEPVAILAVLSSAYLDLYRVRASVQSGLSATEPAKHFDYARKEFRLRNAERDAGRYPDGMFRGSLKELLAADIALKSSRGDRRIVLEKLIARLLILAERGKTA
ncbi:DNA polymerase III subunit delta [Caproiciproducens sp. NJN-50]|uniref:DNA polymerase III subunit delta n=1 Tax=Acutalibacteraceae TaxID=3082771 RepID=UPI000FFE1F97|nr:MULTISPECIES: DNA polymerase III subunit delta [Acutalibacteraceae]QAT49580.1 DNA polymerase III subunit delta [Caproiciproducens sp. NJN-50]